MKIYIIILILFFSFQLFSQEKSFIESTSSKLYSKNPESLLDMQIKYPSGLNVLKERNFKEIFNKANIDTQFLLIEGLNQHWPFNGTDWENKGRAIYNYDTDYNLIEDLNQDFDSTGWVNDWRFIFSYDLNNNNIEKVEQNWDSVEWVNLFRDI